MYLFHTLRVSSQQNLLDQRRDLCAENEELKSQVISLSDVRVTLERENDALIKRNTALGNDNNQWQSQVTIVKMYRHPSDAYIHISFISEV